MFDKVLVLWLDAYSNRFIYLPEAKFIRRLAEQSTFALIRPTFAYRGIGYSISTGASINKHRVWMEHSFKNNNFYPTLFKRMISLSEIMPSDILQKIIRLILYRGWRTYYGTPHLIPAKYLDYFTQVKPRPIPTLFDVLREKRIKYRYCQPKTSIGEAFLFHKLPSLVSQYELVYAKLNSLDRLGHKFGPLSNEVRNRVRWLDVMLERSITEVYRANKRTLVLIFSDHGMTPVTTVIDLERILALTPLKVVEDYVAFEGSTYWAFFFLRENVREIIEDKLTSIAAGKLVAPEAIEEKWGVEADVVRAFGDAFYVLKEGYAVFPDFYRRHTPPNGMHGYFNAEWDAPMLIMSGHKVNEKKYGGVEFQDIVPTIYNALGISIPIWCDGKSLQLD
jgi:predicted AlkP superfamily pyrophosphatase or phosphodiesterase